MQVLSASQIRTMFSEVEAIAMMHETQLLPQLKQKITVRANADSLFGIVPVPLESQALKPLRPCPTL
eukprot:COSAG04_NODE_3642_length_2648_cov_1.630836_4_plen_67_part_00